MIDHTPGPWHAAPTGSVMRDGYTQSWAVSQFPEPNLICGCFSDVRGGEDVASANAQLVAAAPELLEALKAVLGEWREGYGLNCVDQVRAAIKKATA